MSRNVAAVTLAAVISSTALSVHAVEANSFYVGAGYGAVKLPDADGLNFSNPKNGSLDLGYNFTENWALEGEYSSSMSDGSVSATEQEDVTSELRNNLMEDYNFSYANATQAVKTATVNTKVKAAASIDSLALYAVYRTSGPLYAKFKAGVVSVKTKVKISAATASITVVDATNKSTVTSASQMGIDLGDFDSSASNRDTDFSGGIGAGYRFNDKISAELEYTVFNSDYDFYSLSFKYAF